MKEDRRMRPRHWLYTIPLGLRSLFRWAQADRELDDELRDHLERKTEEYVAQGMTPEEARRRARLDLDGIEQRSEEHTSELQSRLHLVCRLLLEKKKTRANNPNSDTKLEITAQISEQAPYRN